MAPLIDCRALEVGYGGTAMLPRIEVDIEAGVFYSVVGRNGSGKSTWFKTVLGLQPPVSGQVVHQPGLRISYIPQRLAFDAIFPLSVTDVVAMGKLAGGNFVGLPRRHVEALKASMESVDVWKLREQSFHSLSEGQKQRVLFARALASEPQVAFMDEPTAAMDVVAEREMLLLVDRIRRERHMAVVMVSHELSVATHFAEQVFFVDRTSRVVLAGKPAEVFASPMFAQLYTQERADQLLKEIEHVNCERVTVPHDHDHAHTEHT